MKALLPLALMLSAFASVLQAGPTHLDIMVPDLKDTDLRGPVKSVELKVWRNVSGEFSTEKKEYDRTGNLIKSTEHDENGKLLNTTDYIYDENGCYERMHYKNEQKGYESDWDVVLNPETRQIALREKDGRIGIETYSPEGYLLSYQLMDKNKKPLLAFQYKRDENNRLVKYTRIEERSPVYTYYFKWADNGFIDMERQIYHQEKAERLHTYEYLVTDGHGNWTQRIMVRYDTGGKKKEKVYEHTVQRTIEYFDDPEPIQNEETGQESAEPADTDNADHLAVKGE